MEPTGHDRHAASPRPSRRPILAAWSLLLATLASASAFANDIPWQPNWAAAESSMKSLERPGMIYFYNLQARPCKEMQEGTFRDPEVVKRLQGFVCVALIESDHKQLASRFKLFKVPTVVFLDSQGRELDKAIGYKPPDSFTQYLDRVIAQQNSASGRESQSTTLSASAAETQKAAYAEAVIDLEIPVEGTRPATLTCPAGGATSVYLVGDFNDWRIDATPMRRQPDGNWTVTVHLPDNAVYEYLFLIDGVFTPDERNPKRIPNPYGGTNSALLVGTPKSSPAIEGRTVTFIRYDAAAKSIRVAGTFNNWNQLEMFRNPADPNMWGVRYTLPPGEYGYKYIVDGTWETDKENYTPVADGNGNINSTFVIR